MVENSYSYGLVLVFDDLVSHDIYQAGSVHLSFVDANLAKWTKVVDNARFLFANSSAQANGGKPRIPAADDSFDSCKISGVESVQ